MYLWKYWRETRITFGIGILVLAVLTAFSFKGRTVGPSDPHAYSTLASVLFFVTAALSGLFAWAIGSFGAGRSLGEGAGSYLLTRPKPRSWFTWRDWGFGLALIAAIVLLSNLLTSSIMYRVMKHNGIPLNGVLFRNNPEPVSLIHLLSLNSVSIFLCCGLIFGIVYLMTILTKNALGIVVGAGVVAGYVILSAVIQHYWPGIELPNLLLRPYTYTGQEVSGLADNLGLAMVIRAAILLLFPITAKLVLERSDI